MNFYKLFLFGLSTIIIIQINKCDAAKTSKLPKTNTGDNIKHPIRKSQKIFYDGYYNKENIYPNIRIQRQKNSSGSSKSSIIIKNHIKKNNYFFFLFILNGKFNLI